MQEQKPDYVVDWRQAGYHARERTARLTGSHPAMPGKPLPLAQTRGEVQAIVARLQQSDPRLKGIKVCLLNKPEGKLLAGISATHRRDVQIRQHLGELSIHIGNR